MDTVSSRPMIFTAMHISIADDIKKTFHAACALRQSVRGIAIAALNNSLRPILAKWHPLLQTWEAQHPPDKSPKQHEQQWCLKPKLRAESESLRQDLEQYANALAVIAGVQE